ncbi:MAG: hypothetical protein QM699_02035 [Amaricoccus sp.]|uniref:hypothetical protein n=1 Tax=Amaricoccus sp. TaxID=1872485 RepID=UPI0039E28B44
MTARAVPGERYDEAVEILDAEGSVDLGERADTWRAEGWAAPGAAFIDDAPDAKRETAATAGTAADMAAPIDAATRHAYGTDVPRDALSREGAKIDDRREALVDVGLRR